MLRDDYCNECYLVFYCYTIDLVRFFELSLLFMHYCYCREDEF